MTKTRGLLLLVAAAMGMADLLIFRDSPIALILIGAAIVAIMVAIAVVLNGDVSRTYRSLKHR